MRQEFHRYLLAPAILLLHALLLLPILVPYKTDSPIPESSLHTAIKSARYSIPLGCLAFVAIAFFRLLVGSAPLPSRPDRGVLASRIEWSLLFIIGVAEELARWALVRYLVKLEGGGEGYGGKFYDIPKKGIKHLYDDPWTAASVEVQPGIWEGVYLMGWTWSFLESLSAWWYMRPLDCSDTILFDADTQSGSIRSQSYQQWRKGHTKKRSTDSTIRTIRTLSRKGEIKYPDLERGLLNNRINPIPDDIEAAQPKMEAVNGYDDRASSPELSRRSIREEDNFAGDEETSATDNDNEPLDSPMTPTIHRPPYSTAVPPGRFRENDEDPEDQEESTPTQQKHNARFLRPGSVTSESDYFGVRPINWASTSRISPPRRHTTHNNQSRRLSMLASDSETESPMSGVQTPLLSSSIPFEQEQQALLERPQMQTYGTTATYQSTGDNLPLPPELPMSQSPGHDRPNMTSHPSQVSVATGDEAEDESESNTNTRAYPSFPTYSSSYNHSHFPSSMHSNATYVPPTPAQPPWRTSRPNRTFSSQSASFRKARMKKSRNAPSFLENRHSSFMSNATRTSILRRHINGIEVNHITLILAILWRVISALQHTGYGLWFAWLPAPMLAGIIQWWSVVFFGGVAFSKGVYVAQSNTGWVASSGLLWPTTIACFAAAFVLYFVVLVLWGVLW